MEQQTLPSEVLYEDLKDFQIKNVEAARLLLSAEPYAGGKAPRERIGDRTFLSREVKRSRPGSKSERFFADLPQAASTISGRVLNALIDESGSKADATAWRENHYFGEAAAAMRAALRSCDIDDRLYANALVAISGSAGTDPAVRGQLACMLFVITGCLGDPARAAQLVEGYMRSQIATGFRTATLTDAATTDPAAAGGACGGIGLVRVVDGRLRPTIYPVSESPCGCVIGSLASGPEDITDVGRAVSRHHLRIWHDASSGAWLCVGMESTNGSTLISGADGREYLIEPPRRLRAGFQPVPVRIAPGDTLVLGGSTRFRVLEIASDR